MMKSIMLGSLLLLVSFKTKDVDLDYLRKHYTTAVADKNLCEMLISKLNKNKLSNVHLAYLGGFQTIWANHTFNPLTKLITFKRGKANIDKAIVNEKDNIEIRFIRLSVQKNCPRFLGYYKNIQEDESYLNKHVDKVDDHNLKELIRKLLKK